MENIKILSNGVQFEHNRASLVVEAKNGKQTIGYIRANLNTAQNCVELDTAVVPEFRGQGVVGQILDDMLERLFVNGEMDQASTKLGKGTETERVVLSVNLENVPGKKSAEKLGFTKTETDSRNSVEYEMTKKQYFEQKRKLEQSINL